VFVHVGVFLVFCNFNFAYVLNVLEAFVHNINIIQSSAVI